jgi:hypothetical protein
MTDERAADLPVGSIIANDHTAWIKVSKADNDLGCWSATSDGRPSSAGSRRGGE